MILRIAAVSGIAWLLVGCATSSSEPAHVQQILAIYHEDIQEAGASEASWQCIEDGLRQDGYIDELANLTDAEVKAVSDGAFGFVTPVSDLPVGFQRFNQGLGQYFNICFSADEMASYLQQVDDSHITYGSDPNLDLLYDGCIGGSNADCDMLWLASPANSEYEDQAVVCGGRTDPIDRAVTTCMLTEQDLSEQANLKTQCEDGFFAACDLMFAISPDGSEDWTTGATCGGIREADRVTPCWFAYGFGTRG